MHCGHELRETNELRENVDAIMEAHGIQQREIVIGYECVLYSLAMIQWLDIEKGVARLMI